MRAFPLKTFTVKSVLTPILFISFIIILHNIIQQIKVIVIYFFDLFSFLLCCFYFSVLTFYYSRLQRGDVMQFR